MRQHNSEILDTRFDHYRSVATGRPLSLEEIESVAPSVFADSPHASRSASYTFISTARILDGLAEVGFHPFFAAQSASITEGRRNYTKHMLRLRREVDIGKDEAHELLVLNSSDGSSRFQLLAGLIRFACANGLIIGNGVGDIRVRHSGRIVEDVVDGALTIAGQFTQVADKVEAMKETLLTERQQLAFARAALPLRFDGRAGRLSPEQANASRRREDDGDDLYRLFNRVQENFVRGGQVILLPNQRRRQTVKAVQAIDANVTLNRRLWNLAEEFQATLH